MKIWETGEIINAEDLKRIERSIEEENIIRVIYETILIENNI